MAGGEGDDGEEVDNRNLRESLGVSAPDRDYRVSNGTMVVMSLDCEAVETIATVIVSCRVEVV